MATKTVEEYDGRGNLVRARTIAIPDSDVRLDTARSELRTVRSAIKAEIDEARVDRDAAGTATLNQLQVIVRRALNRELSALRRERNTLLASGLSDDDGQA